MWTPTLQAFLIQDQAVYFLPYQKILDRLNHSAQAPLHQEDGAHALPRLQH